VIKNRGRFPALLLILGFLLWTRESGVPINLAPASDVGRGPNAMVPARGSTVTVQPTEIDDILYNPGMGFADFHLGFGNPPLPPSQHPRPTVAYFRWSWADLEPAEGQYDFVLVDSVIAQAKAKGETLAFRIMTDYGTGSPRWLLDKGVASVKGVVPLAVELG
jgi:Beta-galactosidase